jgi:two-component system LytT family response regulator
MKHAEKISALIVDDEPLARRRIHKLVSQHTDIEIVGDCANGHEAIAAIHRQKPQLVFLDVQMPEITGFDVLEALEPELMPLVIFVTAHNQYALRALEVHAFDYLLKPFDKARFDKTLQQAKARIHSEHKGDVNRRALALLEELRSRTNHLERLIIKTGGRVFFIRTEVIDWLEAEGKYVRLHVGKETHLLRETIGNLESRLDAKKFLRIHRSYIVNIERIQELEAWFHNEYRVILRDGTKLMMSRSCRKRLGELLGSEL